MHLRVAHCATTRAKDLMEQANSRYKVVLIIDELLEFCGLQSLKDEYSKENEYAAEQLYWRSCC